MKSSRNSPFVLAFLRLSMCSWAFGITTLAGADGLPGTVGTTPSEEFVPFTAAIVTYSEKGAQSSLTSDAMMPTEPSSDVTIRASTQLTTMTSLLSSWAGGLETAVRVTDIPESASQTLTEFKWSPISWTWYLILQFISGIVGIVGNLLVIIVLFQRRAKSRSTDSLIGGLACADFLTSIFILPIPSASFVPNTWLGEVYCRVIYTYILLWGSITVSAYLLMSISVERYVAVVYPLQFNHRFTRRRVSIFIVIIWIVSVLSGLFVFIVFTVDESTNTCTEYYLSVRAQTFIAYYWFCLRLVIPCLTMLATQVLIARALHRQSARFDDMKSAQGKSSATSVHIVARNRVIKLMLIVILTYIICWSPNQIAYLGYNLGWVPPEYIGSPLHQMLTVLGFYNSCANPVIYTARYPEFREALKDIFTCSTPKNAALFEAKGSVHEKSSYSATPSTGV